MKHKLVFLATVLAVSASANAQLFGKSEAVKNLELGQAELRQGQADLRQEQRALNTEIVKVRETLSQTAGAIDNGPEWFVNPPQIPNAIVVAVQGTKSTDRGRALEKAIHKGYAALSTKINSEVETLTKSFEYETGDSSREEYERFTRTVSKGQLEGVRRLKTEIVREGNQWYAMVLMIYPLPEDNPLRKVREAAQAKQEANLRAQRAEQDLDRQLKRKAEQEVQQYKQLKEQVGPRPEPKADIQVPLKESLSPDEKPLKPLEKVSTNQGELQLLDVNNEEYKQRRAEALKKPNAVIGQMTLQ
jgi:hypothetical protein